MADMAARRSRAKLTRRPSCGAFAEAVIRSVELIFHPEARDVVARITSPEAIVQAKPNDVEAVVEGCVERHRRRPRYGVGATIRTVSLPKSIN